MSTAYQNRRGKTARVTGLYAALVAGWLMSLIIGRSMTAVEWINFGLLLLAAIGGAILAFAPSRAGRLARASARVLWVVGVVMFIRQVTLASAIGSSGVGPALVYSHVLLLSLWVSVLTSATLVLWRERAGRSSVHG